VEGSTIRPKLWTPDDLADYLSVPVGWIYKRTRKNGPETIPHIKLGKYLRFDPAWSAFQDWLVRQRVDEVGLAAGGGLTSVVPVNTVRATEKTGQILTKGESVYGS
jgi:hypothetical protein